MCGIVGAVSGRNVERILIEGLKRLEYRGYDSAGLAVINSDDKIERLRTAGKVLKLEDLLNQSLLRGQAGIAHTRWATHGSPSDVNAHPLLSHDQVAVVHNGIIENHDSLKNFLLNEGYHFSSQTDTETIVHLIHYFLQQDSDLFRASQKTIAKLEGAYALGIMSLNHPEHLIAVSHGCPLVLGKGVTENFFASDPLALLSVTKEFIYLDDGDLAEITQQAIRIYSTEGKIVERKKQILDLHETMTDKGKYRHYMMKEIAEQPRAIQANLEGRIAKETVLTGIFGLEAEALFRQTEHIQFVACGTSYHACMVARYWLEGLAGISCSVEVASEFRYRKAVVPKNSLFVVLSQSGETADTLSALRLSKKLGFLGSVAICNVGESPIVREADFHFLTRAGIEIGVASTKAFTTQLVGLLLLTLSVGRYHQLTPEIEKQAITQLKLLPQLVEKTLEMDDTIKTLAKYFLEKEHALFLGRGALYPIILEGALKLKEISYIHAEGYPAGELKHGPLALVDKHMPIIAVAPHDDLLDKLKSNLQVVRARGGELFVFTDSLKEDTSGIHIIEMPEVHPLIAPIVYTIPLQLLAYHVAVLRGTDVDQPRNLAKSVTTE